MAKPKPARGSGKSADLWFHVNPGRAESADRLTGKRMERLDLAEQQRRFRLLLEEGRSREISDRAAITCPPPWGQPNQMGHADAASFPAQVD